MWDSPIRESYKDGRVELPSGATKPASGIAVGEFFIDTALLTASVAFANGGPWVDLLTNVSATGGGGLTSSKLNGVCSIGVDGTVLRTTGAFSGLTSTFSFNAGGAIDLAAGKFTGPAAASFPAGPYTDGQQFWKTDTAELYIYSTTLLTWVNVSIGGSTVTSVTAGLGLSGGGTGAVTIDVGAGDGITLSANAVAVLLATNPCLEFSGGALQFKPDVLSTGSVASVLAAGANGAGVRVDNISLEGSGPAGALRIKNGGVSSVHLNTSAKNAVLQGKTTPGHVLVNGVAADSGDSVLHVSYQVTAAASSPGPTNSFTGTGVYVGYLQDLWLRLRRSGNHIPVIDGPSEVCGRLSSQASLNPNPQNTTGVRILAASSEAKQGGSLVYIDATQTLQWDGGPGVIVSGGGLFKLEGSANYNFIYVEVNNSFLPGTDTSDNLSFGVWYPTSQPVNVTGVTITSLGPDATSGTLDFVTSGTRLSWNAGSTVDVSAGGVFYIEGTGPTDSIQVIVDTGLLPGSDQSDSITTVQLYEVMLFQWISDVETPVTLGTGQTFDFLFLEVFDLLTFPGSALITTSFQETAVVGAAAYDSRYARMFTFEQLTPSDTWTIPHDLNTLDIVPMVYDFSDPRNEIQWNTAKPLTTTSYELKYTSPVAGRALLVGVGA